MMLMMMKNINIVFGFWGLLIHTIMYECNASQLFSFRFEIDQCQVNFYDIKNTMGSDNTPCYYSSSYAVQPRNLPATEDVTKLRNLGQVFNGHIKLLVGQPDNLTLVADSLSQSFAPLNQGETSPYNAGCYVNSNGFYDCYFTTQNNNLAASYSSRHEFEEVLGNMLEMKFYDYHQEELALVYMGGFTFSMPDALGFIESDYGTKDTWASHQVNITHAADNFCINQESYGTCSFRTKFYAVQCNMGEYLDYSLSSSCLTCPEGRYCPDGVQSQPCPSGYYSQGSAAECTPCDAGSYATSFQSTQCDVCPEGTYSHNGQGECTQCAAGHYGTGGSTTSECEGKCPRGYYCPTGTKSATANECGSSPNIFCDEGSSSETTVPEGHYVMYDADSGEKTGTDACPIGSYCVNGVSSVCPELQYQSSTGQSSCLQCTSCPEGTYVSGCGGDSPGSCVACEFTQQNYLSLCGASSSLYACSGQSTTDISKCFECSDSAMYNSLTNTEKGEWQDVCGTTFSSGVAWWVIFIIILAVLLVFGAFAGYMLYRRRKLKREIEVLDAQNESYRSEHDMSKQLGANINPMFNNISTKVNPNLSNDRQEEVDELNKHQAKLEQELKRLKMEKQQQDDVAIGVNSVNLRLGGKSKRQFDNDDDLSFA